MVEEGGFYNCCNALARNLKRNVEWKKALASHSLLFYQSRLLFRLHNLVFWDEEMASNVDEQVGL